MKTAAFAISLLLLATLSASAQTTVLCESADGSYQECRLEGAGVATLTRQLSSANCVEGQTWGYRDGRVWVDRGCRAHFALTSRANASLYPTQTLTCESTGGRRSHCRADTSLGVLMVRQLSDSACQVNRTWGFDRNGVWVRGGCRAEFMTGNAGVIQTGMVSSSAPTVICESENGQHKHCRADTRSGVTLLRRLSDTRCERDRSWGVDDLGVWVTNGCRAEFVLDRR